ncbi:MAG TPA: restriction endonuclease subunit S, partial [Candidatus Acetothermia bacterium]|nr:restriction endonuclease subunit S [Candidatus Acetothermia bacterium]
GVEWLGEVPEHWEVKRLGNLAEKIGSGKTPRGGAETYQSEGVLLLRSQNIHDSGLRLSDAVFIDETIDEGMDSTRVHTGDVLLNITGASLGRCSIANAGLLPANVNQHVCIIRVIKSIASPRFVHRSVSSRPLHEQIFSFENGSSREGLNFQQVRSLMLALPPITEQLIIADFLDRETAKIDTLVAKVEITIERLREYRAALITAAVTGKIDVRRAAA